MKERRRHKVVSPDAGYPTSMASHHVPFYIAAKSPMLFVVCRGYGHYTGGAAPLVHLGVGLGDLIDAALTWCASDGNAAATFTQFSRDLPGLGDFVDFDLLCQRDWYNTPDDGDRKSGTGVSGAPRKRCSPAVRHPHGAGPGRRAARDSRSGAGTGWDGGVKR